MMAGFVLQFLKSDFVGLGYVDLVTRTLTMLVLFSHGEDQIK